MKFDEQAMGAMDQAIPLHLRGRCRWIMSPETKDAIRRLAPPAEPGPYDWGANTSIQRLMGIPIRLVEGFDGIALEIINLVQEDGS